MFTLLYNVGIFLYSLGAKIGSLFSKKLRTMVRGQLRTHAILREQIKPTDRVVWFHAASLGEFEQGRPIMERLRREHPEYKVLLSFFSPSGYEVRKDYEGADVVVYLPFDTRHNARKFIRLAHPEIAVFIKYEFWRNYLVRLRRRGVKTYSVSSIFRPGQYFFLPFAPNRVLHQFDYFFVQNESSARLLRGIGIDRVTVSGDTRFDRVLDIRNASKPLPIAEAFARTAAPIGTPDAHSKVFVVGSSWEPDEAIYLPYFEQHRDWKLIIAPHVVSASRLEALEAQLAGRRTVRYMDVEAGRATIDADTEVLIVDCFGKLSSIYRYGAIALVGGGFGAGIHNVPEAAVYGIPVLFGPNNTKFREARALIECGGSFEYTDAESFAQTMDRLLSDRDALMNAGEAAGEYICRNAGAADICYRAIFRKQEE